jgi:hypothetical protein
MAIAVARSSYENAPPLGFNRLSGDLAEIIGPHLPR